MCNDKNVNAAIEKKKKDLLRKLTGKMERLEAPRTLQLANIMHKMLAESKKDFLTADHIELRDFELTPDLVQRFANAQVRTRHDEL